MLQTGCSFMTLSTQFKSIWFRDSGVLIQVVLLKDNAAGALQALQIVGDSYSTQSLIRFGIALHSCLLG